MTTNDATPREHVAMTILFVDRDKPDELIAANWEARKDRNSGLESQEELLRYADNAIAAHSEYLWQAADDPEVVEAALDAAEAANDLYPLDGEPNSVWQARYFSAAFGAFLEQLIGPNPNEQEAE